MAHSYMFRHVPTYSASVRLLSPDHLCHLYSNTLGTNPPWISFPPFLISKQNGLVTYTLDLPKDARIHPRFHVKRLEPADPAPPLQPTFHYEPEEEQEFEIEKIFNHRGQQYSREYLIKWKGYPDTDNTWEPSRRSFPG